MALAEITTLDAEADRSAALGVRLDVLDVGQQVGGHELLRHVSLSIEPGELVAVVGGSGAGKTTLLETMAGLRRPTSGSVTYDGRSAALEPGDIGFVPQDDIIHRGLPLRRTLRYAARLRMPADSAPGDIDRVVDETLRDLELAERRDVPVGELSGGQRKRASIAVELLTRPRVFLLDEPTSGLDPATSADVLTVLRRLADRGVTVVLTTHDPDGRRRHATESCSSHPRVTWPSREHPTTAPLLRGHQPRARLPVPRPGGHPRRVGHALRCQPGRTRRSVAPPWRAPPARPPRRVGPLRQGALLTLRNADVLVRSRLTLAVLVGSPVLVISMMAVLFRAGGFEQSGVGSLGPVQTIFWVAFAGFFFGLTYGLLQIVGEFSVFRRERMAGLSVVAYVASKIAVLLPLLVAVNVANARGASSA